jgi:hypothetical protein
MDDEGRRRGAIGCCGQADAEHDHHDGHPDPGRDPARDSTSRNGARRPRGTGKLGPRPVSGGSQSIQSLAPPSDEPTARALVPIATRARRFRVTTFVWRRRCGDCKSARNHRLAGINLDSVRHATLPHCSR